MSGGIPKLTRGEQFRAVLGGSRRAVGRNFLVRALPNVLTHARLGLIASRKTARRAIDRNRGKRLAREVFRIRLKTMPALDIVIQQKTDLRKHDNATLRHEIEMLLETLGAHDKGGA